MSKSNDQAPPRTALRAGQLVSALTADELETMLNEQEKRWWNVKVQNFKSKTLPEIRWSLPPAATHCSTPYHSHRRREQLVSGTKTRSCAAKSTCSARLKSSLTVGASIFQSVTGTLSETSACSLLAPCGKRSMLSSPSWDRSDVHVPSVALGQNRSSGISGGDPLLDSKGKNMAWMRRLDPRSSPKPSRKAEYLLLGSRGIVSWLLPL